MIPAEKFKSRLARRSQVPDPGFLRETGFYAFTPWM